MPVTISVTLPDDLAEQAKAKGLLSPDSLISLISEVVKSGQPVPLEDPPGYPPEMDPRLKGAVNPLAYGRGKIVGNVIDPIEVVWEADA